jgi:DNA (cytosine-5)-methyltransferase 1
MSNCGRAEPFTWLIDDCSLRTGGCAHDAAYRTAPDLADAMGPKWLVMENVPGILTIGDGAILEEIYGALERLGYECETRILYAEDYGVPQERRRVFFIATRLGSRDGLFPDGSHGPVPKPSEAANPHVHRWGVRRRFVRPPSVWAAIGDLPQLKNGGSKHAIHYARKPRTEYKRRMRGRGQLVYNHVAPNPECREPRADPPCGARR